MPKHRRSSTANDTRPAFARPPGVRAAQSPPKSSQDRTPDDSEDESPRRSPPKRIAKENAKASPVPSPAKRNAHGRGAGAAVKQKRKTSAPVKTYDRSEKDRDKYNSGTSTGSTSQLLSVDALSKLNSYNERAIFEERRHQSKEKKKQYKNLKAVETSQKRKKKNRDVSGAILEEGRGTGRVKRRGGGGAAYEKEYMNEKRNAKSSVSRRKWWCIGGFSLVALILIIVIAVIVSNKHKSSSSSNSTSSSSTSSSSSATPTNACDSSKTPTEAKGTYTDISTWLDTTDFNCTYTAQTVGGLSVMGLNSNWDDSVRANSNVPPLNQQWNYGKMPIRGTNIGGWLNLEPFITPSFFSYAASDAIVDEWTLCTKLGSRAQSVLENHYATFITKQDFQQIANAGLDHVRIPFGYWAVTTYDGDPFVKQVSWRYLLRAIEWARECGLRVNLDPHGMPGSQNGWAHSGRQGDINWLNGANGDVNGQRSLDIHNQLSQFFAQDRYKNVVTIYGLVNEPKMLVIDHDKVLNWNKQAISIVRNNGIQQQISFGDGFLALTDWKNMFQGVDSKLMLDTHQYQIFNTGQLKLTHQNKINLACSGWTGLMVASNNPSTGWGPTLNGEWSQADTDCTPNLNNVGQGSRWAGTLNTGDSSTSVTTQSCASPPCSCAQANADPKDYSASYKQFLQMYAEAQMHSFEQALGWFYWTWKTESATQWSWKLGLAAGILPSKAYSPSFKCDSSVPSFSDLPENY